MVQNVNRIVFITDEEYQDLSLLESDVLYLVSCSDKSLSIYLDGRQVSNLETVESLTPELRSDMFYVLIDSSGSPLSVYYKYLNDGQSYFAPVTDFRLQSISQSITSGVVVEIDGSSLRVLALEETGKNISKEDLKCIKDLSGLENIECRIFWEET